MCQCRATPYQAILSRSTVKCVDTVGDPIGLKLLIMMLHGILAKDTPIVGASQVISELAAIVTQAVPWPLDALVLGGGRPLRLNDLGWL